HLARRIDAINEKLCELKEFDKRLKIMVNLETSEDPGEKNGIGGSDQTTLALLKTHKNNQKELIRSMHEAIDDLNAEIALGKKEKVDLDKFLENQKMLLASTPSIWPTRGWLSSGFGYRISPFTGQKEFHKGIDISTRMKAPIVAPANGIVTRIAWDHGYGRILTLTHGHGIVTRYAHLSKVLVKKGQYVKRGETIALVGNTGRSTGPHLHYEVLLNGMPVNPLRYILN
ncbi:MAG: peptidase M24, partial [Deltaproteobacteria bacterium]